jgi:hypothetical protein
MWSLGSKERRAKFYYARQCCQLSLPCSSCSELKAFALLLQLCLLVAGSRPADLRPPQTSCVGLEFLKCRGIWRATRVISAVVFAVLYACVLRAGLTARRSGSIPDHSSSDLCWAKWYFDRFSCVYFGAELSGSLVRPSTSPVSRLRHWVTQQHAVPRVTQHITWRALSLHKLTVP